MNDKYNKLSLEIIEKATDGDLESINQIVKHYEAYLMKQSLRPMKDEFSKKHMVVDELLYGRMKSKLIRMILKFEIY